MKTNIFLIIGMAFILSNVTFAANLTCDMTDAQLAQARQLMGVAIYDAAKSTLLKKGFHLSHNPDISSQIPLPQPDPCSGLEGDWAPNYPGALISVKTADGIALKLDVFNNEDGRMGPLYSVRSVSDSAGKLVSCEVVLPRRTDKSFFSAGNQGVNIDGIYDQKGLVMSVQIPIERLSIMKFAPNPPQLGSQSVGCPLSGEGVDVEVSAPNPPGTPDNVPTNSETVVVHGADGLHIAHDNSGHSYAPAGTGGRYSRDDGKTCYSAGNDIFRCY